MVGDTCSERLALGAASGTPARSISRRVSGKSGHRRATVGPPAVTIDGTCGPFGTTTVTGPGQRAAAIRSADSGHEPAKERAIAASATCTISGLAGRPPLGPKDPVDRLLVEGIGRQAVDRFGRDRDQPS